MRFTRILSAGLLAAGVVAVSATPAQAVVVDSGIVTSSVYLSRGETRWVAREIDGGAIGAGAGAGGAAAVAKGCATVAKMHWAAGVACVGGAAVYGTAFVNATRSARNGNGCLRIRYTKPAFTPSRLPVIVGFYNDGGRHCKN
ncbi:hypothetical protein [Actinoplanes sp. RD1]|uniref:hypothetical protein n=1 Tax=Actinoplanes sp. RD1 TaxID=3064538 RepID=UPI0027403635|nr:hypothetical protein [Actinoplanes sp. RD1]